MTASKGPFTVIVQCGVNRGATVGLGEAGAQRAGIQMELIELLNPDDVVPDLSVCSKRQLLEMLAARAAEALGVPAERVFDVLMERESVGTTGIGRGVAIPHGRLAKLARPHALFARLREPVAFDSVDNRPVDLVFVLLAPDAMGAEHLNALARISRLLRDNSICERLRQAASAADIYLTLAQAAPSQAA